MTNDTRPEPKKKPVAAGKKEAPVHVIREGAIAASIWRRSTGHGMDYLEYTLSRSWKSKADKTGYSHSYFPRNEEALLSVVKQATAYITTTEAKAAGHEVEAA